MKLIGIIGKSGSGKTTLSRMLKKDNSVGIIHLDDITSIKSIVKRMPTKMTQKYTNNIGEEIVNLNKGIRSVIKALRRNKLLNKMYFGLLRIPREFTLKRQINKCKENGKKCVIIERMYIR